MKRPWQCWCLYVLGVLIVAGTMGWLTIEALQLDRAEASARRQAELEENIGRALWRMDVRLMPLIAKEAARPYFVYQPFYLPPQPPGVRTPPVMSPSPLLTERPEFILLNFQVDSANQWTSAQLPAPEQKQQAIANGADLAYMLQCETNMAALRQEVAYPSLLESLPRESISEVWSE